MTTLTSALRTSRSGVLAAERSLAMPVRDGTDAQGGKYVDVGAGARVGVIGDNTHVEHQNIEHLHQVMPRRAVNWPVVVGRAPGLASAYQERTAVLDVLDAAAGTVVLRQVVAGGGGVGKTQIAAGQFHHCDADLRVWVLAGTRAAVLDAYAEAAVRLDLADREEAAEARAEAFLGFLAGADRSWLVVLDDLQDPADLTGLWPEGQGRVLVTTRRRDASLSGGGRTVVPVGVYSDQEARTYLTERLGPSYDDLPPDALVEVNELAADLGNLPLALAQAAAVMINDAISTAAYRRRLADRLRGLDEVFPQDADADGYARTVASTWRLAMDAADQIRPAGLAAPMGCLVAGLNPSGIPEGVLTGRAACELLAASTGREEVSAEDARAALRALHRLSLLDHRPAPSDPMAVRMHNLTGRAILADLPAPTTIAAVTRTAADGLLEAWPAIEKDTAMAESLRANSRTLLALSPDALLTATDGAHLALFRCGLSMGDVGLVHAAIAYWTSLARLVEARLGSDHPDTLSSCNNLAGAYESGGDLARAVPLYEQSLADRQRVLGPDHPDTLTSRNNLAHAYESGGDLARAVPLYEQNLADMERVLGPDHPDTLMLCNNLACAYASGGDLARAVSLYEQNLADMERVLGPDDLDTLRSRNNLAGAYELGGDLARAVRLFEQNLADRRRVLGPDHPDTLMSCNNLAGAYESGGDLARAVRLFEQNLADMERVLGPDHPDTLISRNKLGGAYESGGDLARAVRLFEQNLADRQRVLGPDHPDTLISRNNLAHAYESGGDLARAVPLYEQNLADMERVLGPDHPDTLMSCNNLAGAYTSGGDLARAVRLSKQNLADVERVLGPDHPHTLHARNNLAYAYRAGGNLVRAVRLFEQNLADRQRVLGPDHPDTLTSRNNLAGAYASGGDLARAVPLYKQNLADMERVLGPDHPDTLISRNNLAGAYASGGDLARAVPLYKQNLADMERVLGPDHPHTLSARSNLAYAQRQRPKPELNG
ncbi:tetratricopeptide repeat protein [Cellulomonas sp. S1-8]|uniref:tetratricopeptide repeat protein n=1 Tax=Cellulomonas sp. S1-8 TaxID=2904790 RepID=UPI002244BF5A|nr:tetratricopeptide repeat protein [Cellulomonas sp. S1-8]UZN02834.1 tetratricopeptide repeat protein [Cellulomonas sp. S1-8]